ncbi:DUF885 domain-containing protein [Candidatus Leptofilum sp.]|uniref:DUF885 domain-containing protein n=1 Tax=Candidatus Leptofilum sp. TaxID=3241576 RepID=UPI003B5A33F9
MNLNHLLRRAFILLLLLLLGCGGDQSGQPVSDSTDSPPLSENTPETETETAVADPPTTEPTLETEAAPSASPTPEPALETETSAYDDIDDFFDASYSALLLRDPELISEIGLDAVYGTGNNQLTDISDAYIRETQALEVQILAQLRSFDRASLTPEQQLSYDIYEFFLADRVAGHEFMYHNYPVTFFITSVPSQLETFMTDLHPIANLADAEGYISRLSQVGSKFDQLLEGLRIREEMNIIPPRFIFQWTLPGLRQIANGAPRSTPFYTAFEARLDEVGSISDEEKARMLATAETEIEQIVIPAYGKLVDYLVELENKATTAEGVWKLPDGDDFYAYTLQHHTTTNMTADEIHELGWQELERIQAEMRLIFDELGYPDEPLPQLYERVAQESGFLSDNAILAEYEALIAEAAQNVADAFDLTPQADVVVIGVESGGYYIRPSVDGSRPGAFYASAFGTEPRFAMPTLAYHEAIPGHHFQLAIMQELPNLPAFRNGASFTAYVEGWALYAELLAAELGFYEDDPYGDLGRLQGEAFRAARLVVDAGIHAKQWNFNEAVTFMRDNTGLPERMVQGQIARYIIWPGQATAYKVGMIEIVNLRQQAMEALGDEFDIKAFHNVVIGQGSLPLGILETAVEEWLANEN